MKPRVRFAPSPTGPLHIGGVRTALYNYLFAKKHGGDFLLRIEDTDSNRFVPGAEEYIIESFKWLGIPFDEGVDIGGEYGPYRQSERKAIYKKYVDELLSKDLAYIAFDTHEELEEMKKRLEEEKSVSLQYDAKSRLSMRNSLTMSKEEVAHRIQSGEKYVVRIKIEPGENIHVQDLIRGDVVINSDLLDDKVLWKSADFLPTYHLANIVDDHKMKITHVIRGEEWLPSAPLHVLLYRYLGWEDTMPQFAHLPLLLKPEGNGKLSKRDGDKLGFPVFPLEWTDPVSGEVSSGYREMGYLPEAVINLLAFLGWNPGTEQEIFSLKELVEHFSLERVSKHGAKFDVKKARWFNHQYLMKHSEDDLVDNLIIDMKKHIVVDIVDRVKVKKIISLMKERVDFANELWAQTFFFFERPTEYDEKTVAKYWKAESATILDKVALELEKLTDFSSENLATWLYDYISNNGLKMGDVMNGLRLALVGKSMGPHINEIMDILGKKESIARIQIAIEKL
ncbi:glutamate--tRNA ligase [Bacteroidia bacterium]|nr:glutamate--tRNA ligase [Bacteroidia bacterium]